VFQIYDVMNCSVRKNQIVACGRDPAEVEVLLPELNRQTFSFAVSFAFSNMASFMSVQVIL
jgi:hypothetical protein